MIINFFIGYLSPPLQLLAIFRKVNRMFSTKYTQSGNPLKLCL